MKTEKITQLNVDIPESVKGKLKMVAILESESLKEVVIRALSDYAENKLRKKGITLPDFNCPPQCFVNANQLFA